MNDEKCKGITSIEEMEKLCKESHSEIVDYMFNKYIEEILVNKKSPKSPTIYIIGGQNASGKSTLIHELSSNNPNYVSIIIDDMKAHHPFRSYIDKNFPNKSEDLLHIACFDVFDKTLQYLLENNYDVLIERTLGSKENARKFLVESSNYDYDIQMHVTATHEINSLLSVLERFIYECNLKDEFEKKNSDLKITPRPITLSHHNRTYENICDVIQSSENGQFTNKNSEKIYPKVFIWDRTIDKPTNIYETGDGSYSCAKHAMYDGRLNDLNRCKSNDYYGFDSRLKNIQAELNSATPSSTLGHFKDYCNTFVNELEQKWHTYVDRDIDKSK